jgi:hypothetical protein
VNPEGWIVLVVGIATVAAQIYAAHKGAGVAREQVEASKKQVAASEAALRNEATAVLVVSRERRAVDAVFRACPVVELTGYSRPLIRVEDYRRLLADSTYGLNRVRPCGSRR